MVSVAMPAASKGAVPKPVFPSLNIIGPVGVPPADSMVAVNVTGEPGAAFAGAARVNVMAGPVISSSVFAKLGRNVSSPWYCAPIT